MRGDQESTNMIIGVDPEVVAQLHMHYRSSIIGRRTLGKDLVTNIKKLKDFSTKDNITNRNVEILQAYLKSMGYRIEFFGDEYRIPIHTDYLNTYEDDGKLIICTEDDYDDYVIRKKVKSKYENDYCVVMSADEYEDFIDREVELEKLKRDKYVIEINV